MPVYPEYTEKVLDNAIQTDVGNPSIRTNLQSLEAMLGNPDTAGFSIYAKMAKDASFGTLVNTGGIADLGSILGDFVNNTLVARLNAIDDYIDTEIAALQTGLEGGTATVNRAAGKMQPFTKVVTSAANAGNVTMATVTSQNCYIESIVVRSNGATTSDLTSITVRGGASNVTTFIDTTLGQRANIAAIDQSVSFQGATCLPTSATIVMTLAGTGATAVNLDCIIYYRACVNGGYLV